MAKNIPLNIYFFVISHYARDSLKVIQNYHRLKTTTLAQHLSNNGLDMMFETLEKHVTNISDIIFKSSDW